MPTITWKSENIPKGNRQGNQRLHGNAAEAVGVSLPSGMSEALGSLLASKGEEKIE